jgi:hypothetical protein
MWYEYVGKQKIDKHCGLVGSGVNGPLPIRPVLNTGNGQLHMNYGAVMHRKNGGHYAS